MLDETELSFPANNKHVGFDPKSLWLADPCPVPAAQSCESESTDGKGSVTGRCNGSCPPLCSMALLTCADTVASVVAPALCPLDAKHVEVKEEGDQVDHHYMTYIQVFALLCREKYHKNSFFFFLCPFSPAFRYHLATAVITHRYKCHSLPLLNL